MSNSVIAIARRFTGGQQKSLHEMVTDLVPEDSEDLEILAQQIRSQQGKKVEAEAEALRAEGRAKEEREKLKHLQDQFKAIVSDRGIFSA